MEERDVEGSALLRAVLRLSCPFLFWCGGSGFCQGLHRLKVGKLGKTFGIGGLPSEAS